MTLIALEHVTSKRIKPGSDTFGSTGVMEPLPGRIHVAKADPWGSDIPASRTLCNRPTEHMTLQTEWRIEPGWRPPGRSYCRACFEEADQLLKPL